MRILKSKTFIITLLVISVLVIRHIYNRYNYFDMPKYGYEDVSYTFEKENLTDNDYDKIFKMTGLSPKGYNDMLGEGRDNAIKELNRLYFEKSEYEREYIFFPLTAEETMKRNPTPLAPLKNGDILITFSTHTLDWRHGHAAIVTDENKGVILEHMSIGNTSTYGYATKWGRYPNFIVLRHFDSELAKRASEYAKENLYGIDYNLFTGFFKKDKSDEIPVSSSHCSHIVWQAYKAQGVDIDANGGIIVTPKDISLSDELSVVQIFGINPEKYSGRVLK